MRVSFLGTGLMGRPMAERLIDGGYEVTVYNRTRDKALPLAEKGARIAASAREAVEAGECTVIMLKDAGAIRGLLEEDGRLPDLGGRTIVQMSTISSAESLRLMEDVRRAGGDYLEAPVLGSTPQAREGTLLVAVGSTPEQFERWGELLRRFGSEPRRIGPVGHAATLKLAINQLIGSLAASFSLSLGMVQRSGLDVDGFMDVLRKSTFYAPTFDRKLPNMLARDFSNPNFPAALLLKDVDLVLAEAAGLGLRTEALEGVRAILAKTVEEGLGEADYSALYGVVDPG